MTAVTIVAVGSRGDVQPYIALGAGLSAAGYRVAVATHTDFEALVAARGLRFAPVAGNPRREVDTEAGRHWVEAGANPVRFVRRMMRVVGPLVDELAGDVLAACRDSDLVVQSALAIPAHAVAERLRIPLVAALLQPLSRTRAFPSVGWPRRRSLGGPFNLLTHVIGEQIFWQAIRRPTNRWRRLLGLDPIPLSGPYRRMTGRRVPVLYGFSPSVVPRPADWPAWQHVTGYWFLDRAAAWEPPGDLAAFLAAGEPPIYVGFGSLVGRRSAQLTEIVERAIDRVGCRAVLLTGWGGLTSNRRDGRVFTVGEVPHDWLFPRMAAVVHHGGSGTTGAGLRAGRPTIVVPFFADQPFWGHRVAALGAGPPPISQRRLTEDGLARAISRTLEDEAISRRAEALGAAITRERGVTTAVETISGYFGPPR